MKKFLIILLAGITLCMSACQPTPENPVVINKNDGKLQESIHATPAPKVKYKAMEKWTEKLEKDNSLLKINIDADIYIPDVEAFPVYRVTPEVITEEMADNFITACIGDEEIYKVENVRTKEDIMNDIISLETEFDDPNSELSIALKNGIITQEEFDAERVNSQKLIKEYRKEYNSAPETRNVTLAERKFEYRELDEGIAGIFKWYEMGGRTKDMKRSVYVSKDYHKDGGYGTAVNQTMVYHSIRLIKDEISGRSTSFDGENYEDLPKTNLKYDEALEQAENFVHNKLGYTDYQMSKAGWSYVLPRDFINNGGTYMQWRFALGKERSEMDQQYEFIFTKTVDNIPSLYYDETIHREEDTFDGPKWGQNYVKVTVDDYGIYEVDVISSINVTEKINDNVSLLEFDKIQDIFRKQIYISINYDVSHEFDDEITDWDEELNGPRNDPTYIDINIKDIRLGYVKVREQGKKTTDGMLIPVWIFYGAQINNYADGHVRDCSYQLANPFLCINAIDGSIIDLVKGY